MTSILLRPSPMKLSPDEDGTIIREGAAQSMIDEDTLREVFDHKFHIINVGERKVCVYFQPPEAVLQNQRDIKQL